MRPSFFLIGLLVALPLAAQRPRPATVATPVAAPFDSSAFRALQWRNIGPFRGGRANAVTGVPSQPLTYYAGYTGGGVWKTEDAGVTWRNISDGFFRTSSIGAIAVAESDPNVVYVGTGEHAVRGQSSSFGDGVYKSTDAGKTWTHVGLNATRQISAVRVHPRNPDLVYVAAQGDRWIGTPDRGIYRSTDGGKSWALVLKGENATSGASALAMDASNPRMLYAAFWDHQRVPWKVRSGGPGSGIWKSTDGGDTWTRLTAGLPALMGKIGVDVSAANPARVFAIVEAEKGGLYRSDDAGKTWQLLSADRLIQTRSWYYMKVTADPRNADVVWVTNAPILRSIDGGRTFATVPAKHGDNHQLWINPSDARYIANANDGGATISLDGGKSWSTQDNQPTAQLYHVAVDDVYPYRLYGGQQDNSSVIIKSRSDGAAITGDDWSPGPGCENANIGVNRASPRFAYGGCYQGLIEELDTQTGLTRQVMPYPALNLTEPSDQTKYRFNWTAPILVSQHTGAVYHGGNVLFRTNDRGKHWTPISPDLTRNDKATQGLGGGPITNEGAGGEVYNTIIAISESPRDAEVLWVGTDDGLVHVTRDGGRTWSNVTPTGVGEGLSNHVEASPHDAATAYLAFRRDRRGEYSPYAFKTSDFGKTWTKITAGLRDGEPVRSVRADPARPGLLYAATETGVYVSFDDGGRWWPFSQNLPVTPVTDLVVRHDNLYASTEGRAFWVLDDLSAVRQVADSVLRKPAHLYAPRPALQVPGANPPTRDAGRNAPPGANVYYHLATAPDTAAALTLEFLDARGAVVRTYSSSAPAAPGGAASGRRGGGPTSARLTPKAGLNAMQWDLRADAPTQLEGISTFGGPSGGALVTPGRYQVRLRYGSVVETQPLEVRPDPRIQWEAAEVAARDSLSRAIVARVREIHEAVLRLRDVKEQVDGIVARTKDVERSAEIADQGKGISGKVDAMEPKLTTKSRNGQDIINYRNGINAQYIFLLGNLEGNDVVTQPMRERFVDLERAWQALRAEIEVIEQQDVAKFNRLLQDAKVPGVIVPATKPKVAM
jgi:photosystem II stability/assembly factor-like uncharacterized protein